MVLGRLLLRETIAVVSVVGIDPLPAEEALEAVAHFHLPDGGHFVIVWAPETSAERADLWTLTTVVTTVAILAELPMLSAFGMNAILFRVWSHEAVWELPAHDTTSYRFSRATVHAR